MRKITLLTALLFACFANAQLVQFSIDSPQAVCYPGDCIELYTTSTPVYQTQNYAVSAISYGANLSFPFTGGTVINNTDDDVWSPIVNLPFNFSFYGTSYNQMLVGSNGVITFSVADFIPNTMGQCPWNFTSSIPNATFPIKNAIYGIYQDQNLATPPVTNQAIQNANYYFLDTGVNAEPNRVFVVNYNSLPLFGNCSASGLQTSQIVLHEGSNIIEVFVHNRTACPAWNSGNGLIGIQNASGTAAVVPAGRNTGAWSAVDEAWRFTPTGAAIPQTINWTFNGLDIATGSPVTVCPNGPSTYTGTMSYTSEGGNLVSISKSITLSPIDYLLNDPLNLSVCSNNSGFYTVNIDQDAAILVGQDPSYYTIRYYENEADAANTTPNNITNLFSYYFTTPHTIYVSIEDLLTGCIFIRPFELVIMPPPGPPTGVTVQGFSPGQTLADLVVDGENIIWYDAPSDGNVLPSTTLLVDGMTYYASQVVNGCESRNIESTRLAVTVYNVLGTKGFDNNK